MRGQHDTGGLFTPSGGHNHPIANKEIVPVGSEVVDTPGIPKPHADHALSRRGVVDPEDRVIVAAAALTDLLARFEPALEALARPSAGLLDGSRRRPGSG
jgi:hypothetical protein